MYYIDIDVTAIASFHTLTNNINRYNNKVNKNIN